MVKKKLRKVYFVESPEKILDEGVESLLMCSTKNWNHYFEKISDETKKKVRFFEELKNLNLVEFASKKEMFDYLDEKDSRYIIDWSTEHNKPLVLEFNKV